MKSQRNERELEVQYGFHGTAPKNIKSICQNGLLRVGHPLNPSNKTDDGFFGMPEFGVYLGRRADYTLKYSNHCTPLEPQQLVGLIMFKVLPGRERHIPQLIPGLKPTDSPGFDSHTSSHLQEWYLFSEDQCCPLYVLVIKAEEIK